MKKLHILLAAVALVVLGGGTAVALSPAMAVLSSMTAISCATTATKIALDPATPARSICVQNMEAVDVYIGGSTVTTANGFKVPSASAAAPQNFCFDAQTAWCVVASSTSPIRVVAGTGYSGR